MKHGINSGDRIRLASKVIGKLLPKRSSRPVQEYLFPKIVYILKGIREKVVYPHGGVHIASATLNLKV